jgi:hypothetical protein
VRRAIDLLRAFLVMLILPGAHTSTYPLPISLSYIFGTNMKSASSSHPLAHISLGYRTTQNVDSKRKRRAIVTVQVPISTYLTRWEGGREVPASLIEASQVCMRTRRACAHAWLSKRLAHIIIRRTIHTQQRQSRNLRSSRHTTSRFRPPM